MNFVIRMLLLIFMVLGLCTSAFIANARVQGWSFKVVLWTVIVHLVLAGFALVVAVSSKATPNGYRVGLSPAGWLFGSLTSYLVGLVGFWFVK